MTTTPHLARDRTVARLVPHLAWEAALLVAVVGVCVVGAIRWPFFAGPGPWWTMAVVGLVATGLALSLRTGMPNLAIGATAVVTGACYASLATDAGLPPVVAAAVALIVVVAFGAVLGLVTGLTAAPAWAVSLGGLALAYALTLQLVPQPMRAEPLLSVHGWWLALFVVVTLAGGALWAFVPGLRQRLGPPAAGDAEGFRLERLVRALVGFTGSSLLAGLAGLAMASQYRSVAADMSMQLTLLALAAVLIGGVSAAGGRGGVAGTLLGAGLVAAVSHWLALSGADIVVRNVLVGLLILAGLGVGRALGVVGGFVESGGARARPVPPGGAPAGYPVPPGGATADAPAGYPVPPPFPPPAVPPAVPPGGTQAVPPAAATPTDPSQRTD